MDYKLMISDEERKNIKDRSNIYNILKNSIQFLEIKPGTRIIESEISAELGVSRTPIREALLRLSNENLVEIFPQKGIYVAKIDIDLVKQLSYMRKVLETDIFMQICEKKAKIDEVVTEHLYFMKLAADKGNVLYYLKRDEAFHKALFSYAGFDMVWTIISNNKSHYNRILALDMTLPDKIKIAYKQHLAIVACIENGDKEGLLDQLAIHYNFGDAKDLLRLYPDYFVD